MLRFGVWHLALWLTPKGCFAKAMLSAEGAQPPPEQLVLAEAG